MIRITPPLDPMLVSSMREYAAEEHTEDLEPDAPDMHCPWAPSMNGSELIHLGQRTDKDAEWVDYLDELFIRVTGRKLTLEEDQNVGHQP